MTKKTICNMICENILDESGAESEYMKLVDTLNEDGYPEEALSIEKLIITDEKKHLNYLKKLSQSHNCQCKK